MANIGAFQKTKNGWSGRIRTLVIDAEVVLIPARKSDAENAPDFRIHIADKDGPEVGAAWKESGEKAGDYLSLQLDDPTLPLPIRANLFWSDDEESAWSLHWNRSKPRDGPGLTAMRSSIVLPFKIVIPLFAERPSHPVVPLGRRTASARSVGQGRPPAGASRAPLTAASTLAGLRCRGDRALFRYAVVVAITALSLGSGSGVAIAQSVSGVHLAAADPYAAHIAEASKRFGIPERWIRAVLRAESAGDVRAISSAGAMGLMQVMPDTWAELRARHRLGRNPYDPRDNILAGTGYLREMWDRYGDVAAMLAAYNAGPARYDELRSKGRPLPAETRAYVASLAPALRGERPSKIAFAVARPADWREAAIFVVRDDGTPTADPVSPDRAPNDARSLVLAKTEALTASPEELFVARRDGGDQP